MSAEAIGLSLEQALDRIDAFRAIHEPGGVTLEAVLCLQESVGIDDATRVLIRKRLFEAEGPADPRAMVLGLIIGLLAAGFGETDPRN